MSQPINNQNPNLYQPRWQAPAGYAPPAYGAAGYAPVQQAVPEQEDEGKGKRRVAAAFVGGALALTLAMGGVLAYLTDTESVTNNLSLDTNLSIALTEPNWDPEAAKAMTPTMEIAKDPTITNDGTVDEYVFAKVQMPVFTGSVVGEDGKATAVTNMDLYAFTVGEGWTQIGEPTVADGVRTYTYQYSKTLAAGEAATPVFDKLITANLTSDVGITDNQVILDAFSIQKQGFDTPAAAWAAYNAQQTAAATDTNGA